MQLKELQSKLVNLLPAQTAITDEGFLGGQLGSIGLFIYRNNRLQALRNTLGQHYPTVLSLLGQRYFEYLTKDFIAEHPPQQRNLNLYGDTFPDWLSAEIKQREELVNLPYIVDIAGLDHALQQSYYAPNRRLWPAPTFAQLTDQQQRLACLQLARDISLIKSEWPLVQIQQSSVENIPLDLNDKRDHYYYMVHRDKYRPQVTALTYSGYNLGIQFQQTTPLCQLSQAQLYDQHNSENIDHLIPIWIQRGWIDHFFLPDSK